MLQEGKQALDYEMDNQYGAIESEGQVVVGCGEKLVAHDVGCGDAHQNGHTKDGGHKYPQVGEDSLVPHLRRKCKRQIIGQDFSKTSQSNLSAVFVCKHFKELFNVLKTFKFVHHLLVQNIYCVNLIIKHNYYSFLHTG